MKSKVIFIISLICACALFSCSNPANVLGTYDSNFTSVATAQADFVLNKSTQELMLESMYEISSEQTLCLTAPVADADSYFWQLVEFKGTLQYAMATQSVSIYVPELDLYPDLRTGKVTASACFLTLKVKKDGETYTDTAVVFIKRE